MKIVVIGGTGLIGSKTVAILRQGGHEAIAASPKSGIKQWTYAESCVELKNSGETL
jgi:nucleoside-diphosphate-sugar epimerase